MTYTHECPADGCEIQVEREHLMCREHWFLVPKPLRDQIWRAWREWENGRGSSAEYIEARDEAIAAANEGGKQGSLL